VFHASIWGVYSNVWGTKPSKAPLWRQNWDTVAVIDVLRLLLLTTLAVAVIKNLELALIPAKINGQNETLQMLHTSD